MHGFQRLTTEFGEAASCLSIDGFFSAKSLRINESFGPPVAINITWSMCPNVSRWRNPLLTLFVVKTIQLESLIRARNDHFSM